MAPKTGEKKKKKVRRKKKKKEEEGQVFCTGKRDDGVVGKKKQL